MIRRRGRTADLTKYTGPIVLPTRDGLDDTITRMNLTRVSTFSTDSLSKAIYKVDGNPTAVTDWASIAAVHQEYRVVAFQVEYKPFWTTPFAGNPDAPGIGAACNVHVVNATPLASLDVAVQNTTHIKVHTHRPWKMAWRMHSIEEAVWNSTAVGVEHGSILAYVAAGTASFDYGELFITYLVELRGRK